jgi:hypothetical protein
VGAGVEASLIALSSLRISFRISSDIGKERMLINIVFTKGW